MFTSKTVVDLATTMGATMNFLHLVAEQRQKEMWAFIMPHPVVHSLVTVVRTKVLPYWSLKF